MSFNGVIKPFEGLGGVAMKVDDILTREQEESGLTLHDDEDFILE